MAELDFDYLEHFKEHNLALKLLRSSLFPLLGSFFYSVFIRPNRRSVPYQELIGLLDHHLADISESNPNDEQERFPKSARAYIDDWINIKGGYLRKYLPQQSNEAECDLLPDVEKALRWLEEMQGKAFVGTESRLKLLLDLIADLVHGTSKSTEQKLQNLQQRKAELEQQVEAVKLGLDVSYSATQVREKIYLITDLSRQLLGDFRQVEANFRDLDKDTRKKITLGGLQKGAVLDTVFDDQDIIDSSDEGKSFSAFFELIMRGELRENMRNDLRQLLLLPYGSEISRNDTLLSHLYSYLLDAGAKVNGTKQQITDQLRRYIQQQSQDNKRILELLRDFEIKVHNAGAAEIPLLEQNNFVQLHSFHARVSAYMSRGLYEPRQQENLNSEIFDSQPEQDVDLSRLYEISRIDEWQLQKQISQCLQQYQGQVTLAQIVENYPIKYGLDELLTYVKLACEQTVPADINDTKQQLIQWQTSDNTYKTVQLPSITFVREL